MLAILTSHPIQYQAPLWRELAKAGIDFEVWFLTPHAVKASFDREFGQTFAWDLDLLEGYSHRFLSIQEGWRLDRFRGIKLRNTWREEFQGRGVTHLWVEGWRFFELWLAVRAARQLGIRVMLRGETHGMGPERALRRALKRPLMHWLFNRVDDFLYIGSANRRYYLNHDVPPARLHPAPYCIDNERFARSSADLQPRRSDLRRRWKIADDAWVVLFCGKLIPKKRPLDLVAAAKLRPTVAGRPMHLLFAGDGQLGPAIAAALSSLDGATGTITGFLNQTEIPSAFAVADCLVLPSDYGETWGLVVNEALASGLPVVVSDHCGCAEDLGLRQGQAHVYPCGDPGALAASLAQIASAPPAAELLRSIVDGQAPRHTAQTVRRLVGTQGVCDG